MLYLKRIIGLLLVPLSFIIPKKKNKWLFGSNMGYTGNTKHLYAFINETLKEQINSYWITDRKEEARKLSEIGLPNAYKWSLKGLFHSLTAKVYFYNSYISDVNEYTFGNIIKINLWHGVALKYIERTKKPPEKKYITRNPFIKFRYFRFLIKPDFVLSPSHIETDLFARSFGIDKNKCIEATYPRNEIFKLSNNSLIQYIKRFEYDNTIINILRKLTSFKHKIIYMPTWRDSGRNFFNQIDIDLTELDKILIENNSYMIVKLHPATKLNIEHRKFHNISILKNNVDIYPLLPFTDCLITDYSSVYYDYILMKDKRTLLYIPDIEEYTNLDRDFAFPFETSVAGEKIYSFQDLIHSLKNWVPQEDKSKVNYIISQFWTPNYIGNQELIRFISKKIDLHLK